MKTSAQDRADLLEIRENVTRVAETASEEGRVALAAIAYMADVLLRASDDDKAADRTS